MHNCYFRRLLHAPPQSDYLKLLNPQVLGQLPNGQGAPQLSWPKDIGCDCRLLTSETKFVRKHHFPFS